MHHWKRRLFTGAIIIGINLFAGSFVKTAYAEELTASRQEEEKIFVPSEIEKPEFSHPAGFYTEGFTLTLTAPAKGKVYYTTDGSVPQPGAANTLTYKKPIVVKTSEERIREAGKNPDDECLKATVIRAVFADSDGKCSDIVTNTYFVSADIFTRYQVSVVSLSVPEEYLYDEKTGIISNPEETGREWEREVHFEFFSPDGKKELDMNVGARIHGAYSRTFNPKSFRLYARDEYDTQKTFKYDFFSDGLIPAKEKNESEKNITKFKHLLLRSGGNEAEAWESTYFRDVLGQSLANNTKLDTQAYRPAVTFINGEYYGIQNIRERMDTRYLSDHYNCKEEDTVIYDFQYERNIFQMVIVGPDGKGFKTEVHDGEDAQLSFLEEAIAFAENNDLSVKENYEKVQEYFDIDNYIDYVCIQVFTGNTDWPANNCRCWRYCGEPSDEYGLDGKIRWLLFDTDFGFGLYSHPVNEDTLTPLKKDQNQFMKQGDIISHLFRLFCQNSEFVNHFCIRYSDLLNTSFTEQEIVPRAEALGALYAHLEEENVKKYPNRHPYQKNLDTVINFAKQRGRFVRWHLGNLFSIGSAFPVTICVEESTHGRVLLNSLEIAEEITENGIWTGNYFSDLPLRIQAVAEEGYVFDHWKETNDTEEFTLIPSKTGQKELNLTPVFVKAGEQKPTVTAAPEPTKEAQPEVTQPEVTQPEVTQPEPTPLLNGSEKQKNKPNAVLPIAIGGGAVCLTVVVCLIGRKKRSRH